MSELNQEVILTIDMKKNRIRVNRQTLAAIGMPNSILLLVNPQEMSIAVKGTDRIEKRTDSQMIVLRLKNRRRSIEVYSHALVTQLRILEPKLKVTEVYHLHGKAFPEESIAVFPLRSAESVSA